jgi:hypothetical protein
MILLPLAVEFPPKTMVLLPYAIELPYDSKVDALVLYDQFTKSVDVSNGLYNPPLFNDDAYHVLFAYTTPLNIGRNCVHVTQSKPLLLKDVPLNVVAHAFPDVEAVTLKPFHEAPPPNTAPFW